MDVTVKISEEVAEYAKSLGLTVETYVEQLLAQQVAVRTPEDGKPRTAQEIRAWLDSLAQFSDKIPPLPEIISREWIYQDYD